MSLAPNHTEELLFSFTSTKAQGAKLLIEGKATTNTVDQDGECINLLPQAIKTSLPVFLSSKTSQVQIKVPLPNGQVVSKSVSLPNQGCMRYHHGSIDPFGNYFGNRSIGKVLKMEPDYSQNTHLLDSPLEQILSQKTRCPPYDITATCEITDPEVIDLINNKVASYFSLKWLYLVRTKNSYTGEIFDSDIAIVELTVTPTPANREAVFSPIQNHAIAYKYQKGDFVETAEDYLEITDYLVNSKAPNIPHYSVKSLLACKNDQLIFSEAQLTGPVIPDGILRFKPHLNLRPQ